MALPKNYHRRNTKKGFLCHYYYEMNKRVSGIGTNRPHLYKGKSILSREEFYEFSLNDPSFNSLFDTWVKDDVRDHNIVPSLDRLDGSRGYDLDNIEWITARENKRRGIVGYWKKKKERNDS